MNPSETGEGGSRVCSESTSLNGQRRQAYAFLVTLILFLCSMRDSVTDLHRVLRSAEYGQTSLILRRTTVSNPFHQPTNSDLSDSDMDSETK
jgi:hypothetical protein